MKDILNTIPGYGSMGDSLTRNLVDDGAFHLKMKTFSVVTGSPWVHPNTFLWTAWIKIRDCSSDEYVLEWQEEVPWIGKNDRQK